MGNSAAQMGATLDKRRQQKNTDFIEIWHAQQIHATYNKYSKLPSEGKGHPFNRVGCAKEITQLVDSPKRLTLA
jgi:hypothetical protein